MLLSLQALELHWKSNAKAKQQQAFTEDASSVSDGGPAWTTTSLPVWVDVPLHQVVIEAPADQQTASLSTEGLSLSVEENCQPDEDDVMMCDGDGQESPSESITDATSGIASGTAHSMLLLLLLVCGLHALCSYMGCTS